MPAYPGAAGAFSSPSSPNLVVSGQPVWLFGTPAATLTQLPMVNDADVAFEAVTVGEASIAFTLPGSRDFPSIVPNIGFEIDFNGNPGAISIQIQESDTDGDGFYITPSPAAFTITAVSLVNGRYIARVDIGTFGARFGRLLVSSFANAATVKMKAKVTLN